MAPKNKSKLSNAQPQPNAEEATNDAAVHRADVRADDEEHVTVAMDLIERFNGAPREAQAIFLRKVRDQRAKVDEQAKREFAERWIGKDFLVMKGKLKGVLVRITGKLAGGKRELAYVIRTDTGEPGYAALADLQEPQR